MKRTHKHRNADISERILSWYALNQRDLPWRKTRDPYPIWISEIMLQQTRVDTVIPYFQRFLKRFPTVKDLAGASLQEVLKVWENLGYYGRARHLHAAAREIVRNVGNSFPHDMKALQALPGIGPYTAGAILCFAFGERVPTIDANVQRVLARIYGVEEPAGHGPYLQRIRSLAEDLIPEKDPAGFNQAMMDLGAMVCMPRNPSCGSCPIPDRCEAFQQGRQDTLPAIQPKSPLPHRVMVTALIRDRRGRHLVVQRRPRGLLGGLWKFPGGEMSSKETLEEALKRTVRAELGIRIRPWREVFSVNHAYTHFRMTLHAFFCSRTSGTPRALSCEDFAWVEEKELSALPFSRVERKVIHAIGSPS